jgi:hypothetical protein
VRTPGQTLALPLTCPDESSGPDTVADTALVDDHVTVTQAFERSTPVGARMSAVGAGGASVGGGAGAGATCVPGSAAPGIGITP